MRIRKKWPFLKRPLYGHSMCSAHVVSGCEGSKHIRYYKVCTAAVRLSLIFITLIEGPLKLLSTRALLVIVENHGGHVVLKQMNDVFSCHADFKVSFTAEYQ